MKLKPIKIEEKDVIEQLMSNERYLAGNTDAKTYYRDKTPNSLGYNYTLELTKNIGAPGQDEDFIPRKAARFLFPIMHDWTEEKIVDQYFGVDRYILPRVDYVTFFKDIGTVEYEERLDIAIQEFTDNMSPGLLAVYGGFGGSYIVKSQTIEELDQETIERSFGHEGYIELDLENMITDYSDMLKQSTHPGFRLPEDFKTSVKYFYNHTLNKMIFITNNVRQGALHVPILIYSLFQNMNEKQTEYIRNILTNHDEYELVERVSLQGLRFYDETINKMEPTREKEELEYYQVEDAIEKADAMLKRQTVEESQELGRLIKEFKDQAESHLRRIQEIEKEIKELQIKKFYLDNAMADGEENPLKDLIEFMFSNKDVIDFQINSNRNTLVIAIKTYLDIYEEEFMRLKHRNSRLSNHNSTRILDRELFLDANYRVKTQGIFEFDLTHNRVKFIKIKQLSASHEFITNIRGYNTLTGSEFYTNPHLEIYDCSGENRNNIESALRNKNFIGAIMATFATYRGINFVDDIVMSDFYKDMLSGSKQGHRKILEDYEGNSFTPLEIIEKEKGKTQ